ALDWNASVVQPITSIIHTLGAPNRSEWTDSKWFAAILQGIEALDDRRNYEAASTCVRRVKEQLTKGKEQHLAHASWSGLSTIVQERNVERWNGIFNELLRLESLEEPYQQYLQYKTKLEKAAPQWINQLEEQGGQGTSLTPPADWKEAWKWSQGNTWLSLLQ